MMKNDSNTSTAARKYLRVRNLLLGALQVLQVLAVLACASGARAETVRVRGIALNATKTRPAANLSLELIKPTPATESGSLVATVKTGPDGRFDFGPREVDQRDLLLIRAAYAGYGYLAAAFDGAGQLKPFGVSPTPDNVQISVYESATKPPPLTFQVHHLAIESSAKGIKCIERIVVENPSNATYVGIGKVKGTVLLDVPAGAREIKLDPKIPGKLVKTSHGWAVTTPIPPSRYTKRNPLAGPSAIIFEYLIDWPSSLPWARKVDLSQRVLYPTNYFFVARKTDDKVLQVAAPRLGKDEEQELPIGDETEVRVVNSVGRPASPTPALKADERLQIAVSREVNPLFWTFAAFLAAIVLAVPLALRGAKNRGRGATLDEDDSDLDDLEEEVRVPVRVAASRKNSALTGAEPRASARVSIAYSGAGAFAGASASGLLDGPARAGIESIASLDEDLEAGRLSAAEHGARRARVKEALLKLLEESPQEGSADSTAASEPGLAERAEPR
jgi:hypothetical protein